MADSQSTHHVYFDLGTRTEVDERTTYHGSGWHTENGETVLNPCPETKLVLGDNGALDVFHNGRRAW